MVSMQEVIIVGGGLSGLVAAQTLKANGVSALVLDKGKSTGGRLATRRLQDGLADHGAQFFTVRTPVFQEEVDRWMAANVVRVWGYGWSDGSLKRTASDGHPRYIANNGMNAIAQHLEIGLDVRVNVQVKQIEWTGEHWLLTDTEEGIYIGKKLILTPPVPQSLELLAKGNVPLSDKNRQELGRILYDPCLCGMFVVEGGVELPEPGAVQNFNQPVYWIADNQAKGISDVCVITTHASATFSRENYDAPEEETLAKLAQPLELWMKPDAHIVESQLKKWRYSAAITTHAQDYIHADELPLFFAGDAFGGRGRVEGAFISGQSAAKALLEL